MTCSLCITEIAGLILLTICNSTLLAYAYYLVTICLHSSKTDATSHQKNVTPIFLYSPVWRCFLGQPGVHISCDTNILPHWRWKYAEQGGLSVAMQIDVRVRQSEWIFVNPALAFSLLYFRRWQWLLLKVCAQFYNLAKIVRGHNIDDRRHFDHWPAINFVKTGHSILNGPLDNQDRVRL